VPTITATCDGIGCANTARAAADGRPQGWIALVTDDTTAHFCSWECVNSVVNEREKLLAGEGLTRPV
jgi:hypothetical protein